MRNLLASTLLLAVAACGPTDEERAAERAAAIEVVEQFGGRLMHVNLLVPPDSLGRMVQQHYGPYVTTLQLGTWMSDLRTAPGRQTSSPFPARVEVREVAPDGRTAYHVTGQVLHVTELDGDPVLRTPFTARVVRRPDGAWRIAEWNSR